MRGIMINYVFSIAEFYKIRKIMTKQRENILYKGEISLYLPEFSAPTKKYLTYLHNLFLTDSSLSSDGVLKFKAYPDNLFQFGRTDYSLFSKAQKSDFSVSLDLLSEIGMVVGEDQSTLTPVKDNIIVVDFKSKRK